MYIEHKQNELLGLIFQKKNHILGVVVLFVGIPFHVNAKCLKKSCNPTLNAVMSKQTASIAARMGDLVGALREMRIATKKNNYLSAKELIELARIQQRYRIRMMQIMEETHHYKTLKSEANLGGEIQTIIYKKTLDRE